MTNVMIIGGHGKVALLAAPLLVEAGYRVTAVIRNPDQAEAVAATGAAPEVADIETLDTAGLTTLLDGQDAVVWSAGAGGGDPKRTIAIDQDAAERSMDAAEAAGALRYVMVSYFGSGIDDIPADNPFSFYAEAKARADDHLRASGLDWTVLGPSRLTTQEPTGRIELGDAAGEVSRGNVARVIVAALGDRGTIRRTIRFNDGDVPIAEALAGLPEES
ncbi:uncharacterized protein YbjT (DUF2867 family) [Naumannella cuiyingiana]|uniref:Uncharacterized protein YbjT (DUF2867 family) n=1 Tax=Naumannella cuiyingiana TaxID=1347891 RepID=A0A7Z0D929_9ACTN|nr:SDR family oxidoreductase [Naumannella cuiyingiana]NYI71198.1 uncharacterized protein YbjT (DUF2867 family) [Naumannella cuiyingiana]